MPEKKAPLGICDLCGGDIPHDLWYTWEHRPRLHCSTLCRNTANSRTSAKERGQLAHDRYLEGTWDLHFASLPPEEHHEIAVQAGIATGGRRTEAVLRGERPHQDRCRRLPDETLDAEAYRSARHKERKGVPRSQLSPEEVRALRVYDRLRWRDRDSQKRGPNPALIRARQAGGLTRVQLAKALGVSRSCIGGWERYSYTPGDPALRAAVEALLGPNVFPDPQPAKTLEGKE